MKRLAFSANALDGNRAIEESLEAVNLLKLIFDGFAPLKRLLTEIEKGCNMAEEKDTDGSEVKSPIEPEFVGDDVVVPTLASVPASPEPVGWLRKTLKIFGPGLVTGAADDDPSGIATYSSVGAQFGYSNATPSGLTDIDRLRDAAWINLFGENAKIFEKMLPEHDGDRNVARVASTSDQDAPNPTAVMPRIEGMPVSAKIGFEPGAKIHWIGISRDANITPR
jgi:hypothetical protein